MAVDVIRLPHRNGRTFGLVSLIGISLLAGDDVSVSDAGVWIVTDDQRILIATAGRESAQALYDRALADVEESI